jgi:CheY-like chemotaxis protein
MAYLVFAHGPSDLNSDAEVLSSVAGFFSRAGHRTSVLDDGAAVLNCIRTEQPAVLVVPVMLPGRDGLELMIDLQTTYAARSAVIVLCEISAMVGSILGLDPRYRSLIHTFVVRPNAHALSESLAVAKIYHEQLVLAVGQALYLVEHDAHRNGEAEPNSSPQLLD